MRKFTLGRVSSKVLFVLRGHIWVLLGVLAPPVSTQTNSTRFARSHRFSQTWKRAYTTADDELTLGLPPRESRGTGDRQSPSSISLHFSTPPIFSSVNRPAALHRHGQTRSSRSVTGLPHGSTLHFVCLNADTSVALETTHTFAEC